MVVGLCSEVGGAKKVCQVEAEGGVFATVAHLVDGESGVRVDGEEASEASVRGPWGETGIVLVGGGLENACDGSSHFSFALGGVEVWVLELGGELVQDGCCYGSRVLRWGLRLGWGQTFLRGAQDRGLGRGFGGGPFEESPLPRRGRIVAKGIG